jgi:hypothetical protein
MSVSIPALHTLKKERIVGFEVRVRSGRIAQLPNVPIGWNISVNNDPSWNTEVKGAIAVGAAALDAEFFRHFIVVEVQKAPPSEMPFALEGEVVVTSDFSTERAIRLSTKDFLVELQDDHSRAVAEPCRISPRQLGRDAVDILRVEALSTQPTDGTYSDEGYGQGEFEAVKLLDVLKSPIQWESGHVFRVHPFPGRHMGQDNFAAEHLTVGKQYYLLYTYFLDKEPDGESDLLGLTRCGVFEDTPAVRARLLDGAVGSAKHRAANEK